MGWFRRLIIGCAEFIATLFVVASTAFGVMFGRFYVLAYGAAQGFEVSLTTAAVLGGIIGFSSAALVSAVLFLLIEIARTARQLLLLATDPQR
jgi:hypothetical protein